MARILIAASLAALALGSTPALAGDAAAGGAFFKRVCSTCHGNTTNSPPGIGPRLYGVVGRKAGSLPGYHYSAAMSAAGFAWSQDKLTAYLTNPQGLVKGNKMPYAGIPKPSDRDNVVAYLATLR